MTDIQERTFQILPKVVISDRDGVKRLFTRIRHDKFYGGSISADSVGCSLMCKYCWNYDKNNKLANEEKEEKIVGKFYTFKQIGNKMLKLGKKHNVHTYRFTGAECFLDETSTRLFLDTCEYIHSLDNRSTFVAETNGIYLGMSFDACQQILSKIIKGIPIYVRISIKAL